jgi:D-alanyl-D-alanine carboxypeptidase/D-alanyl-D-alanine carboxypeptidase (penicillin-binding protein 5/6)
MEEIMKKSIIFFSIVFCIIISNSFASFAALSGDLYDINAAAYILMDSKSGKIFYQNNANSRIYPASTTKIMTAIVALENTELDREVNVTQSAIDSIGNGGMNIGLNYDETVTIENLLYAMLISSANECANLLAEKTFDDYDKFIDTMNSRAQELGAKDTHFVTPSGMHDSNHYTTAYDLSIIAKHAMTIPTFKEIVEKESYQLPPTSKHEEWPILYTKNSFLRYHKESNYYSQITGIKTGYTVPAKFNLVASAKNDNNFELISVVNGVETKAERDLYTRILLEKGFANFDQYTFVKKNQSFMRNIQIEDAKEGKTLNLVAEKDLSILLPIDRSEWDIEVTKKIKSTFPSAPIKKGDEFGYIEYKNNGEKIGRIKLVAYQSIELSETSKLKYKVKNMLSNSIFILIISIVSLLAISFIAYMLIKKFFFKKRISSIAQKFRKF